MPRMIAHSCQVFDQRRHARKRPEGSLVSLGLGTRQQSLGYLVGLFHGQLGFAPRRTFACQRRDAALFPSTSPAVGDLAGYSQPTRYFWDRNVLGEQFSGLLAALFHSGMISGCCHAERIYDNQDDVTLYCETQ